jgi:putative (di)nucleoside polyphosphate hydrolase
MKGEAGSCELSLSPRPGYRPGVGIFLMDRSRRVFVGQRRDTSPPAWQMPQGGIDEGETPVAAALRELREEAGTDRAEPLLESAVWRTYDLPPAIAARMWSGRYRGQTQKWVALRFLGSDRDIDLDGPHPEFVAWRWADPRELADLVVPFKRALYLSVVDEFRRLWA